MRWGVDGESESVNICCIHRSRAGATECRRGTPGRAADVTGVLERKWHREMAVGLIISAEGGGVRGE